MLRKMFNDLLKGGKADFTNNRHDRYRGHCGGILHCGSEIELTLNTAGKLEFIVRDQGGEHGMGNC